jgi:hypothetical protein
MDHDDPPKSRPRPTKPEALPAPTEAELSRIAREAVRQSADPRLDSELARMGLGDAAPPRDPQAAQARGRPAAVDPELELLRGQLRRTEMIMRTLAVVTVILAIAVVLLLIR